MKKIAQDEARTKRARITNRIQHHYSFTHNILSIRPQRKQFIEGQRSIETTDAVTHGKFNFGAIWPRS
jgi:hypothetical protein